MDSMIAQGAEAKLFLEKGVVRKERVPKTYRLKQLDDSLRGQRTRKEARILEKLAAIGFPSPVLSSTDEKSTIRMEHIPGKLLKDILTEKNCKAFGEEMGGKIAAMHNHNIIHGDLTTSNMIMHEKKKELFFVDFGLSFVSLKEEDRAVDLHVLKEALESKHHEFWKECFSSVVSAYEKGAQHAKAVLLRYEKVEMRGRYRAKKGS